jgi:TonB family protein
LNLIPGSILATVVALALLAGCQGVPTRSGTRESPVSSAPREDGGPAYFEEHEVEIPARPVNPIQPPYPPRLRALGLEGDVEARVIVLSNGSVGGGRLVESTHSDFAAAVREALRETRFHPAVRRGKPVSSWVTVKLHFRVEE